MLERELIARLTARGVELVVVDGEVAVYGLGEKVYKYSLHVLKEALSRHVAVVGVVKRSRAQVLAKITGLNVSDKAVAALVLKPCEALVLEHPLGELKRLGCKLIYYKPPRGLASSVKLEVCGADLKQVGWVACNPGWSGLPWQIDAVDSIAKTEAERLFRLLEYRVRSRAVAEGILELSLPLNPQEAGSPRRRAG